MYRNSYSTVGVCERCPKDFLATEFCVAPVRLMKKELLSRPGYSWENRGMERFTSTLDSELEMQSQVANPASLVQGLCS